MDARWAPTSYKWSYKPYKWPYKWVTGVIALLIGVITPFITSRGPTLWMNHQIGFPMTFGDSVGWLSSCTRAMREPGNAYLGRGNTSSIRINFGVLCYILENYMAPKNHLFSKRKII